MDLERRRALDRPLLAGHGRPEVLAEDRRDLLVGLPVLHRPLNAVILAVDAVDGDQPEQRRRVLAIGPTVAERVGGLQQGRTVPRTGSVDPAGQVAPGRLVEVEEQQHTIDCDGLGQLARPHRQWLRVELLEQVDHDLDVLVGRLATQGALRISAPLRVVSQRQVEAAGLHDRLVLGDVHGRVEHHPAHVLGVLLGVHRTDLGAVRVAEIGQLLVADQLAHHVEVGDGLDSGDVREQRPGLLEAAHGELLPTVLEGLHLLRGVRRSVQRHQGIDLRAVVTLHRGRLPRTAWVPADDVVHLEAVALEPGRQVRSAVPRPAGVDEQRPDPRLGGRDLQHEQRDRLRVGLGVVERYGDRGALRVDVVAAAV